MQKVLSRMRMSVVNIRKVSMLMFEWRMLVAMRVRLYTIPVEIMGMSVVLIMSVLVSMCQCGVLMIMGVMLRQVQPDAYSHQRGSYPKGHSWCFPKHGN